MKHTRNTQTIFLHTLASTYHQDTFDKAFITVLSELQSIGFCKNVRALEEQLNFSKGTLYEVLKGRRGIPQLYRAQTQKFFSDNYKVNPKIWSNALAPVFKRDGPPMLEDVEEEYMVRGKNSSTWTMGDMVELQRLRLDVRSKDEQIKELKKELKYWRELAQAAMLGGAGKKPGYGQSHGHTGGQNSKR